MTRREAEERIRFQDLLVKECGDFGVGKWAANLLCRHGKTYARVQEGNCNGVEYFHGESNESFTKRQARFEKALEKREQQLEKRMTEIVQALGPGFGIIFGGDPRGSTVKITVPSKKTTDFGNEGVCVPTA